jgi:ADP-heptose:LPS heptosyltransferase
MTREIPVKGGKHLLIILVAGIGDLVMASKSFRALKKGFPDAYLHLLTSTEAAPLAANYPYLNDVWSFPMRQWRSRKSAVLEMVKTVLRLRGIQFETAVNLYRVVSWSGALRMGLLFGVLNSKTKAGHDSKGFGMFLHKKAPAETFQKRHFVDAMMDIVLLAGGVPDSDGIEVFWDRRVEKKWDPLFKDESPRRMIRIGINPGSDRPEKRWDPQRYALVADRLGEKPDAAIFILGGPGEECIASTMQDAMSHPARSLAGKLTVDELAYLLSRLDLLITNDSGPMHMAAAVKTPVVALFGPEDPIYTRPYTSPDLYRIVQKDLSCRPCTRKKCGRPLCMDMVEPDEVLSACLELLDGH